MDPEKIAHRDRVREALNRIYDDTPPHFREYLRRYREDPTSRVFAPLAEAYRRLGRVDEALEICSQGIEHHPEFHGGRLALAKCYIDKKMFLEAKSELRKILDQVPENLLAQKCLGETCLMLNDRGGALHHLKMASLLSPNDVALAEKVHALYTEVDTEVESLPTSPAHTDVTPENHFQVESAAMTENWREGLVIDLGLETHPVSPEKGIDVFFGKDNEMEQEPFRTEHVSHIFSENPKPEITTKTLGDLYFVQGQFQKSLRIFEQLSRSNPSLEIARKLDACREKLGVESLELVRCRKIEMLRSILRRLQQSKNS